jgi:hypothetical protein
MNTATSTLNLSEREMKNSRGNSISVRQDLISLRLRAMVAWPLGV